MSESSPDNPSEPSAKDAARELQDILEKARADGNTPIKKVESSQELTAFDPISDNHGGSMNSDNGVSIVHSFVNRTVFFDYFRHVAHKRFPDKPPEARVQALTEAEPGFYKRSIVSDYVLKITTSAAILVIGGMIVVKAIFL